MAKRLASSFVNLVYTAILKSFWRKKALWRFLRQVGIAETFLATWGNDESKREFLDRLFAKLPDQPKGQEVILTMARDLAQQDSFSDLVGWERGAERRGAGPARRGADARPERRGAVLRGGVPSAQGRIVSEVTTSPKQVTTSPKSEVPSPQPPTPSTQAEAEAEACFLKAIDIARRQSAKSLELRAVMSLSRLLRQQGKKKKARQLLAEIYGWFTEGFDTADLREAKALLAELAA